LFSKLTIILNEGNDKDLINKVQDPYYLSEVAQTFKDISESVKEFSPWAGAWVGESGGAYNSGGKDVSNTFVNGFWSVKCQSIEFFSCFLFVSFFFIDLLSITRYLDQLGMSATFNHKVYCRQALVGGNYAMLNTTTFIPNPDYYG